MATVGFVDAVMADSDSDSDSDYDYNAWLAAELPIQRAVRVFDVELLRRELESGDHDITATLSALLSLGIATIVTNENLCLNSLVGRIVISHTYIYMYYWFASSSLNTPPPH